MGNQCIRDMDRDRFLNMSTMHRKVVHRISETLCTLQNRVCSVCRAAAAGGTHIVLKH